MYLAKKNFHGNGVHKIAGEFLSGEELSSLNNILGSITEKGMVEEFKGSEGDESHLGFLSCAQLTRLILSKDSSARCGKSKEGLVDLYRSKFSKKEEKKEVKKKKKKKASK